MTDSHNTRKSPTSPRSLLSHTLEEWPKSESTPSPRPANALAKGTAPAKPPAKLQMRDFLVPPPAEPKTRSTSSPAPGVPIATGTGSFGSLEIPKQAQPVKRSVSPSLCALVHSIVRDLETKASQLLTLNPSRREALVAHLERLAGSAPAHRQTLADWVSPGRGHQEHEAMLSYFEEVALVCLSQALILKRWSERGLRTFQVGHLGKLNWELSMALKPHIPLHREGWHVTRPNLYSWYAPGNDIQAEIYAVLSGLPLAEEGPRFLYELCTDGRRYAPAWPELIGYDARFYGGIWGELSRLGPELQSPTHGRKRVFYTPTLRMGEIIRGTGEQAQWIGFESHPFSLLVAELVQLWWGPITPPLWSQGSSLEAHPRDQLPLMTPTKPTSETLLAEMEACDLAWVVEERPVRANARSPQGAKFKAQLEALPFFKKIKSGTTSLGTLQACVALTKLRPGAKLLWAREEPLTQDEGSDALGFLLGRARLLGEWNLAELTHSLPTRCPLFPRYLYLFEREIDHEKRHAHRPVRIHAQGMIRSHVELPLLLGDAMKALLDGSSSSRQGWKIHSQQSPLAQKEWATHWPDPASADALSQVERLMQESSPLAHFGTIRPRNSSTREVAPGFLLEARENPRRIRAVPLSQVDADAQGLAFYATDASLLAPLRAYLECDSVSQWIDHHAERKGERWILTEALLRYLPVPLALAQAMQATISPADEMLIRALVKNPEEAGKGLATNPDFPARMRALVLASRAKEELEKAQARVAPMVCADGGIEWSSLVKIFGPADCMSITQHPLIKAEGTLPPHVPIIGIERMRNPSSGIVLSTQAGHLARLIFEHRLLSNIAWDQMKGLVHPTWSEIVSLVRLPRFMEVAETAAQDVLSTHSEILRKSGCLSALFASCLKL